MLGSAPPPITTRSTATPFGISFSSSSQGYQDEEEIGGEPSNMADSPTLAVNAGQVSAEKVALSSGTQNQKRDSVMARPLKEQAFATPEAVAELVQKVCHFNSCFGSLLDG